MRFASDPLSRRRLLQAGAALGASTLLFRGARANDFEPERHGMSIFGDLKYGPDFKRFDYVNPDAPKGGAISYQVSTVSGNQAFNTFDTLNMFSQKGNGAAGMQLIFDSLMSGTGDEPDSIYGLVAQSVQRSADGLAFRFRLRPEARFHDGSPLTAEDVAYSIKLLKEKGETFYRSFLRDLIEGAVLEKHLVELRFAPTRSRELPLVAAGLPIFSKAYYERQDFEAGTLEPPLGSGAYKVDKIDVGRSITFRRVADYWAKDLPVSVGLNNFAEIRFEYFRDREAAFQAFTAGIFTFREEATSLFWATRYDFPAIQQGRVKREEAPDRNPAGLQGWYFNARRPQFQDRRIRQALALAMDFEWMNRNLMFGSYARTTSFFENSAMKAEGKPSAAELALLEPLREKLDPSVFGEVVVPPKTDGSGQDRTILRQASQLLAAAGCKRDGTILKLPNGQPLTVEFLDFEPSLQRHVQSWVNNLQLLGVTATQRTVDASQFQRRSQEFDYDVISRNLRGSHTPGETLRILYGSRDADVPGSRNLAGIKDPALDRLIDIAIQATSREDLNVACRALDRVLRTGHYLALGWFKPSAWLAYWDMYSRPAVSATYDRGSPATWWHDAEKARRIGL